MEQRSLKVLDSNKTFFSKLTNTLTKILIPTRIGINGMLVSAKRNNVVKAYESYKEYTKDDQKKKDALLKKYEETYTLYLEALDKYVLDSIYKKVKSGAASDMEKNALSKYYEVVRLKDSEYIEYKFRKQKYLVELDHEQVLAESKEKYANKYEQFYIEKMDSFYKGILKAYSVKLADNTKNNALDRENTFNRMFDTLDEYVKQMLILKAQKEKNEVYNEILKEYERFEVGKFDAHDILEKNITLVGISRKLFTHSLPLVVAELCYEKLLDDARSLVQDTKIAIKRENAFNTLINLIEEYNTNILSTKVYWNKPEQKDEFRKFWNEYKEICKLKSNDFIEYVKRKEILFIKNDMKNLYNVKRDYSKLIKYYKRKLLDYGAIRQVKDSCCSYGHYKKGCDSKWIFQKLSF